MCSHVSVHEVKGVVGTTQRLVVTVDQVHLFDSSMDGEGCVPISPPTSHPTTIPPHILQTEMPLFIMPGPWLPLPVQYQQRLPNPMHHADIKPLALPPATLSSPTTCSMIAYLAYWGASLIMPKSRYTRSPLRDAKRLPGGNE